MKPRELKKENTMSKKMKTGAWTNAVAEQENASAKTMTFASHIMASKAEGGAE